jgi:hypothetical protein
MDHRVFIFPTDTSIRPDRWARWNSNLDGADRNLPSRYRVSHNVPIPVRHCWTRREGIIRYLRASSDRATPTS